MLRYLPRTQAGSALILETVISTPAREVQGIGLEALVGQSGVALTDRASPTITPLTLTSAGGVSWLPMRSASSVTMTTSVNTFWKDAIDRPMSEATTARKATP